MDVSKQLYHLLEAAFIRVGAPDDFDPLIKPSSRPEFGDYQANGVMALAKQLKQNPRDLAGKVLDEVERVDLVSHIEIAGPGFLNIHLNDQWLAENLAKAAKLQEVAKKQTVVVDYSAPNLAKEMHVGHLRSTIIGDAVLRVLRRLGHKVIGQNHVGDWGTQFGMLLAHLADLKAEGGEVSMRLADLEAFYQESKKRFDDSPEFSDRAREYVVKLQGGDAACLALWQQFIDISMSHCQTVYDRLGVLLTDKEMDGESRYNDDLPMVVAELEAQGFIKEDQGAKCVFMPEFTQKDGSILPLIVQKSDGGYLYSTSDLASIRFRVNTLKCDRSLYFVDIRQSLHFKQVFALARKAGFAGDEVELSHMPFGTMLGEDGKPFKTRSGGTVKLVNLLDEAEARAFDAVTAKNPDLPEEERKQIAKRVGIGAVKYADLSKHRTTDYVFNWENMLSFEGNTAPYLLYAYARIQSIFRKGPPLQVDAELELVDASEAALARHLIDYPRIADQVAKEGTPNTLCLHLFELAGKYMRFYEACPMLKADLPESTQQSRLRLSSLVADQLHEGLQLLGLDVLDRM